MAFLLSIAIRLVLISGSPSFIIGGDTTAYVAFAREITANHFLIPALNTIHYPGSAWIYPPALLEFFAVVASITGLAGFSPFYAIEISGILLGSISVLPIWKTSRLLFGKRSAIVSVLMFSVYMPNLFALTWGGFPQIFATMIFAWVIYYSVLISKGQKGFRNSITLGLLLSLLVLSHDMTFFVVSAGIAVLIILLSASYFALSSNDARSEFRSAIPRLALAAGISMPAFLFWYVPRIWWIKDVIFPPISAYPELHSAAIPLATMLYTDIVDALIPLSASALLIPLLVYSIVKLRNRWKSDQGLLTLLAFTFAPMLLMVLMTGDSVVFARLVYYAILPSMFLVSYAVSSLAWKKNTGKTAVESQTEGNKRRKGAVAGAFAVVFIMITAYGIATDMEYHSYYNQYQASSDSTQIDYGSLQWIHSNVPINDTIASFGIYGFYIMGFDGNPTLVYENLTYLTQPVEWNESLAAYQLAFQPASNITLTEHLIHEYSVSYVTTATNATPVPSFYVQVYSNSAISIYRVS